MKKLLRNKESLAKIIIFSLIVLVQASSSAAELKPERWTKVCGDDKKCIVAIVKKVKDEKNKERTLATVYIQRVSSIDNKNKTVPLFF